MDRDEKIRLLGSEIHLLKVVRMQGILRSRVLCSSSERKFLRQISEWANVIPSEISEGKPAKVQNLGEMLISAVLYIGSDEWTRHITTIHVVIACMYKLYDNRYFMIVTRNYKSLNYIHKTY